MLQAEIALSELIQSSLEEALHPLSKSLVETTLLNHKKRMSNFLSQFALLKLCRSLHPIHLLVMKYLSRNASWFCILQFGGKSNLRSVPSELILQAAEKPQTVVISCYCRPQNMELILAEDLFPSSLSSKERASHLVVFFTYLKSQDIKALYIIFSHKRRLQLEMQAHLSLRAKKFQLINM